MAYTTFPLSPSKVHPEQMVLTRKRMMGDGQPQVSPMTSTPVWKFTLEFNFRSHSDWSTLSDFFIARKTGDQYFYFTTPTALGGIRYLVQFESDSFPATWPQAQYMQFQIGLIGLADPV